MEPLAKNFINGAWVAPVGGATRPSIDPCTGQAFGLIADSTEPDVDAAVRAARLAFDHGVWGRLTAEIINEKQYARVRGFIDRARDDGAGAGIELPFGGTGRSGHGREKGLEALYEFTRTKTVVINHGV